MVQPVVRYNFDRKFQMFLPMMVFLLLKGDGISAVPREPDSGTGLRQAGDHPLGSSYPLHPQSVGRHPAVDHPYFEDPLIFDASPQFETFVIHKSQSESRDAILEMSSPVPHDLMGHGGRGYNEIGQSETCCALHSNPPQSNRYSRSKSRVPARASISPGNEVIEGSGLHHLVPDSEDTNTGSQRIVSMEFEDITQTSSNIFTPSSENTQEYLTTLHTPNSPLDHGYIPRKSDNALQRGLPSIDGVSTDSRMMNQNNINTAGTSNTPTATSEQQEHWPIQLTEPNTNQSSNDSWSVCGPGYIHENESCWSVCEVIPDYCYNGGECGVIENVGAICRCSAKDHTWYRGQRCQTVITEVQLTCILIGVSLLVALLFLALIVTFALKLRSLKKAQQRFDSRSKLWISSRPQGNSSFTSEISQQGNHSPLARCSPDTQCTLASEKHLTQADYNSCILWRTERTAV